MRVDTDSIGMRESWFAETFDRSHWESTRVGSSAKRANDAPNGFVWFATTFNVIEPKNAHSIYFGGIDGISDIWLNGANIGTQGSNGEPFVLGTSGLVKSGNNLLVLRVRAFGSAQGISKSVVVCDSAGVEVLLRTKYSTMVSRRSEEWVKNAIIYEVYLRSFSPEGTFKGLEHRIHELKRLGVTIVCLMPIHPIGEMNRKGTLGNPYSVQDYSGINPEFGTEADFRTLVKTVHAQGLKIIIELVANHTSWDSKLMFEHSNWFTHDDSGAIVAPAPDWNDVADLNFDHHELRKYMIEMMKHWVRDYDVDGFRCEVAELVPIDFWEVARKEIEKIKPVLMLSDGALPEHHLEAFDITYSWNLHDLLLAVFAGGASSDSFNELLKNEYYLYPTNALRLRFSTIHRKNSWDAPAFRKVGPDESKLSAVLAFTLPGIPLIYNGEEVGNEKSLDLFKKVSIDWSKGEDFRELYSNLTRLRVLHPLFVDGAIEFLKTGTRRVVAFVRSRGNNQVLVVANCSNASQRVELDCSSFGVSSAKEYFSSTKVEIKDKKLTMNLGAYGYAAFLPLSE